MISLTNYDFQWARSKLVIIYPDVYPIAFYKGLVAKAQVHQRQRVIRFDGAGKIFPRLRRPEVLDRELPWFSKRKQRIQR